MKGSMSGLWGLIGPPLLSSRSAEWSGYSFSAAVAENEPSSNRRSLAIVEGSYTSIATALWILLHWAFVTLQSRTSRNTTDAAIGLWIPEARSREIMAPAADSNFSRTSRLGMKEPVASPVPECDAVETSCRRPEMESPQQASLLG